MEMIKVESSTVVAIGYENNTLVVEYNGGTYQYDNVPRDLYLKLLGSKSRGKFLNENIKNNFSYKKIK